jgi:hypothetical protein
MQLLSYLKQLRNNTGILICDKIYIYAYDYSKSDDEQSRAEIEFERGNPDGIKFIEMFSKGTFEEQAVKHFVHKKIESAKNVELIQKEVNSALVTELLRNYFTSKYSEAELEQAMNDFDITIVPKKTILDKPVVDNSTTISDLKSDNIERTALRDNDNFYYRFWEKTLPLLREKTGIYNNVNPQRRSSISSGVGYGGITFDSTVNNKDANVTLFIRIKGDIEKTKRIFQELKSKKAEIESVHEYAKTWEWNGDDPKTCNIRVRFSDYGLNNDEHWDEIINFLVDNNSKLIKIFKPYLKQLRDSRIL